MPKGIGKGTYNRQLPPYPLEKDLIQFALSTHVGLHPNRGDERSKGQYRVRSYLQKCLFHQLVICKYFIRNVWCVAINNTDVLWCMRLLVC